MTDIVKVGRVIEMAARIILENGGETYRAEDTCERISNAMGIDEVNAIALPTGFFVNLCTGGSEQRVVISRIKRRTVNLERLDRVNSVSRELTGGVISLEEAERRLEMLLIPQKSSSLLKSLFFCLSSGFFALLIGGGWFEFIAAIVCGFLVSILTRLFDKFDLYRFLISFLAGALTAVFSVLFVTVFQRGQLEQIIIGAIMPLLPGLAMTNAIRDTMNGDLVSGTAKIFEVVMTAVAIAAGAGVVLSAYLWLGGVLPQ